MASEMISTADAAALLKVTPSRVRQYVTDGRLPKAMVKGHRGQSAMFDRAAVEALAAEKGGAPRKRGRRVKGKGPRAARNGGDRFPLFDAAHALLRLVTAARGDTIPIEEQAVIWRLVCGGPPAKDEEFVMWLLSRTGVALNDGR